MRPDPFTVALRPNERLQYWRRRDLGDATLMRARYGPFTWEKHVHDEQVIVISEGGAGEVNTRRGSDIGAPGSIWAFMPGEYHFGRVQDGGRWDYCALYLDDNVLHELGRHLGYEDTRLLVRPGLHQDAELASILLRAHAFHGEGAAEEVTWSDALDLLFTRYGDPRPSKPSATIGAAGLNLAREYIAEHFRDDISIDDLAVLANVSRFHFIRAFRKAFGMPPHAYINQVRLQRARKLLLAGHSVGVAAGESGFYDQSRLSHLFKRAYGVTPARYAHLANL
jgi:AraC-like DNA-binding protein